METLPYQRLYTHLGRAVPYEHGEHYVCGDFRIGNVRMGIKGFSRVLVLRSVEGGTFSGTPGGTPI